MAPSPMLLTVRGATPLFIACETNRVDCAKVLLSSGAVVDPAKKDGATPLFVSCQNGAIECVSLLLAASADANRTMQDGASPLAHQLLQWIRGLRRRAPLRARRCHCQLAGHHSAHGGARGECAQVYCAVRGLTPATSIPGHQGANSARAQLAAAAGSLTPRLRLRALQWRPQPRRNARRRQCRDRRAPRRCRGLCERCSGGAARRGRRGVPIHVHPRASAARGV